MVAQLLTADDLAGRTQRSGPVAEAREDLLHLLRAQRVVRSFVTKNQCVLGHVCSLLSVYRRTGRLKIDIMCAVISLLLAIALATQFQEGVKVLASDRMEGRGLGTKGIQLAADWIESQLKDVAKPAFPNHSYRQPFDVKTGVAVADGMATVDLNASGR